MIRYALMADEISFLSRHLGLGPVPALATEDNYGDTLSRLVKKRLVFRTGEALSVDMVAALLIKTICSAEEIWEVSRGDVEVRVFARDPLVLVIGPDRYRRGGYLIEPAKERAGLVHALRCALETADADMEITVRRTCGAGGSKMTLDDFAELFFEAGGESGGSVSS